MTGHPEVDGRGRELAALERFLTSSADGAAGFVLAGGAGIGKTTVWNHGVARAADLGHRVLSCRPAEAETALTLSGLGDLFHGVLEEVGAALPVPQAQALEVALLRRAETGGPPPAPRTLGAAALSAVRALAGKRPVLLAVDDVQWLDEASAQVITYLARRLAGEPVGLLLAARVEPPATVPPGPAQALPAGRVTVVRLGPLGLGTLRRILLRHTGQELAMPALRRLRQDSAGNPLYALEIVRSLRLAGAFPGPGEPLPVPASVAELMGRRVRALGEPVIDALLHVALLAHPTVATVRAALEVPDGRLSPLTEAEESGIIEVRQGRIGFTHPLLASAVCAVTSAERHQRVRRRLAEVVGDVEQQARHLALCGEGPDEEVAALLERGAADAWHRGSPAAASGLWRLAAARTPPDDIDGAHRRTIAAARCLFAAGDAAGARGLLAAVVAGRPADPLWSRASLALAEVVFYEGGTVEAAELCRRALAGAGGDPALRAELYLRQAWFSTHDAAGQLAAAEAAVRVLDRPEAGPEPALLSCALAVRAMYRLTNGLGVAGPDLERAGRLLPARPSRHWAETWSRQALGAWAKCMDPAEARRRFAVELGLATEWGDEPAVGHALMHLAEIDCWLGDWSRAHEEARRSIEVMELTGQRRWLGFGRYALALVDAHLGRVAEAEATARRALRQARDSGDPYVAALLRQVLGFAALSAGDPERAGHHLARAAALVEAMELKEPARYMFHGDQIEAAAAIGRLAQAHTLLARLEDRAGVAPRPWLLAVLARAAAVVARAEGDLDRAEEAARRSLDACAALPMPLERGRALLVYGKILRAGKRKVAARDVLTRAGLIFDELGAPLWSAQAAAELRRCGQRRVEGPGLTPTEQEIHRLVAAGLTNREVAGRMFISTKTVEANLTRVYRKLGVRNRSELAALGARAAPGGPVPWAPDADRTA
ncbi:transcriptional regulator [Sphaerisporangium rufum]|uniref:Transcriptional regulator n=1 Tax=Sphaerisporangium rufum TaxID=1381558 RepID=A0A919V2X0_9ACTN|nr:LuxR family transcriptional regulator [Sphaerisporangium rufum]GII80157.1 transcriptional regulator [Sphaerisporangium rufum]